MNRLLCWLFKHCWNQVSIGEPVDMGHGRYYRRIEHRQCTRCGDPGPATIFHYDEMATVHVEMVEDA